ncbi:MAG: tetratricopeptide repeat protein [Elusimicrobiota bacterium]
MTRNTGAPKSLAPLASAALCALLFVLASFVPARAGKTEPPADQSTYWDRIMEAQAARDLYLGSKLLEQRRYAEAVKQFAKAAIKAPNDPKAHQMLGVAYYWSGRVDQAETEFRESLRLDGDDAQTHLLMGIVHAWKGETRASYEAFLKAASLNPERADIQMNLGSTEETLGKYPEALGHFRRAVKLDPEHPLYHFQLGMLHRRLGRAEDAIASLKKAIKLFSGYQDAMLELGAIYEKIGKVDDALELFERAVRLKRRDAVARFRMARACALLGKPGRARDALLGVFHLTPADRASGLALSVSYGGRSGGEDRRSGSAEGAEEERPATEEAAGPLEVLARNLARIPLDQEAVLQVDMVFLPQAKLVRSGTGETPSALKRALEQAGKRPKPSTLGAQREFILPPASAAGRRAEVQKIVKDLRSVLDTAPPDAETRFAMNLKFSERAAGPGAPDAGKERKVSYQPRDVGNDLGLWVMGTGWMALVEEVLEEDGRAGSDAALWRVIEGIGFSTLGEAARASSAFERAIEIDPDSELAYLGLGVAMVIRGDESGAAEAYRRALSINPKNKTAAEGLKWLLREPASGAADAPSAEEAAK